VEGQVQNPADSGRGISRHYAELIEGQQIDRLSLNPGRNQLAADLGLQVEKRRVIFV
jgi:hypothetical protein